MPKEITYGDDGPYLKMPDGNEYAAGSDEARANEKKGGKYRERGIRVAWVKDGFVDVGVAEFDISHEEPENGCWITLDRKGLNRLIRSLKKAGRQAYGEDEW